MNLGFSTKWPARMGQWAGRPNYFIEKIWSSLRYAGDREWTCLHNNYMTYHRIQFGHDWDNEFPSIARGHSPKIHTLREDPHDRWKPGMKIHPAIGIRTKNYFQFAPVMECVSTQKVWIRQSQMGERYAMIEDQSQKSGWRVIRNEGFEQMAINDGFESVEQFFAWFNKDWKGKIIHWTNLRY